MESVEAVEAVTVAAVEQEVWKWHHFPASI
jgi:hypothetical protein